MSSITTTDGTTQYGMLALGATVAVAAVSALAIYGKRCTRQSAPAAQEPEREIGLTVAGSKALSAFLDQYPQQVKPTQSARVTEFKLTIKTLDDGFNAPELAKRITTLFKNLKTVSLTVPLNEWKLNQHLQDFMSNLMANGIEKIEHHVNQRTALPPK